MTYDFVFGNVSRFELGADAADNSLVLSVPNTAASDVADALLNGTRYPLILAGQVVIEPGINYEIVYATAADKTNDTITVERAREGTTAQAWPGGTVCQNAVTAGAMNALRTDRRATDLFQIECLEGESLLDATTFESEVEVVVPDGYRAWSWILHLIPVSLDLGGASSASVNVSLGTSSLGNDITTGAGYSNITKEGDRHWQYMTDNRIGTNDRFYAWVTGRDTDSVTNSLRVVLEVLMGPEGKSGF